VAAGRLARHQGDWAAAHTFWSEALPIWRQWGEQRQIAELLEGLADLQREEFRSEAATTLLEESLSLWRDLGDRQGVARSLHLMGQIAGSRRLFPLARAQFEEALALHRKLGQLRAQAEDLLALGRLMVDQGDCLGARAALEECLSIQRASADRWGISEATFYLGRAAHALGDHAAARRHWEETLALDWEKMGRGGYVVLCLARLCAVDGDPAAVREQYERFILQEREARTVSGVPCGLAALGELALREGDTATAVARYQESWELFENVGDQEEALICSYALWALARHQGKEREARAWRERLLATQGETRDRALLVWALNYLGVMAREEGDWQAAAGYHEESLTLGREIAYYKGVAACLESVAGLAIARQEAERAAHLAGAAEALRALVGHLREAVDERDLEATLGAARAALGPEAFAAAWAEGRALTLAQAIDDALA
jgi:tetratricopeptide (TPR) repeat protein